MLTWLPPHRNWLALPWFPFLDQAERWLRTARVNSRRSTSGPRPLSGECWLESWLSSSRSSLRRGRIERRPLVAWDKRGYLQLIIIYKLRYLLTKKLTSRKAQKRLQTAHQHILQNVAFPEAGTVIVEEVSPSFTISSTSRYALWRL